MKPQNVAVVLFLVSIMRSAALHAQTADTLSVFELQNAAVSNDPRGRSTPLLVQQSNLRLKNLDTELLPSFAVNGLAQYQSTTFALPLQIPGLNFSTPKRDTYDAHIDAREQIFDPSLGARRSLERAQLAQSEAQLGTALYSLRQSVNDAYFTALLLQERALIEHEGAVDLEAQLKVARDRVKEGTALPSEAATLDAALIARRQSLDEIESNRRAALDVLRDLTGREISSNAVLVVPPLTRSASRASIDSIKARPEYTQFKSARDVLEAQRTVAARSEMPRVTGFARAGYGRPGLNPLARTFSSYWLGGVQVDWAPFSWGNQGRNRQVLSLQSQIVSNEEAAFTTQLKGNVENDLASIDHLRRAIAMDDSLVALRQQILRETRARYMEAVITSAEYVDKQTDVVSAELTRAMHRVQLAAAGARVQTTLANGDR